MAPCIASVTGAVTPRNCAITLSTRSLRSMYTRSMVEDRCIAVPRPAREYHFPEASWNLTVQPRSNAGEQRGVVDHFGPWAVGVQVQPGQRSTRSRRPWRSAGPLLVLAAVGDARVPVRRRNSARDLNCSRSVDSRAGPCHRFARWTPVVSTFPTKRIRVCFSVA
jgi:hypothetical protein